jgi:hypothetical protein
MGRGGSRMGTGLRALAFRSKCRLGSVRIRVSDFCRGQESRSTGLSGGDLAGEIGVYRRSHLLFDLCWSGIGGDSRGLICYNLDVINTRTHAGHRNDNVNAIPLFEYTSYGNRG